MNGQKLMKLLAEEAGLTIKLYKGATHYSGWVKISTKHAKSSAHVRIQNCIIGCSLYGKKGKAINIDLRDPDSIKKLRTFLKYLASHLANWDKRIEQLEAQNDSGN